MSFRSDVLKLVEKIPSGSVATYGQIAAMAGSPRAARQVGFALSSLGLNEQHIPWWRVVNSKGYLSIHGHSSEDKNLQAELLRAEGIEVSNTYTLDLKRYLCYNRAVN